jgi:hypothetical protein
MVQVSPESGGPPTAWSGTRFVIQHEDSIMRSLVAGGCAALSLILIVCAADSGAAPQQPKYSIEDVMDQAHGKKGILKKVYAGSAEKADKAKLVELYVALGQNKPPMGSAESWKSRTAALIAASKSVAKGEEAGVGALKKAANCAGCHKLHKG